MSDEETARTKPRVLLDVDGVLADFVSSYLRIVEQVTGRKHLPEHVTQFDIDRSLALTRDEAATCKRTLCSTPGFCSSLAVYPSSQDGVERLQEIADVYVVTSPWWSSPTWMHERTDWLFEHFDIPHTRVIHTSAKHVCRGDFLVDDKVSTCIAWQHEHPNALAIVWDTPHNRTAAWGTRVHDWDALIRIVEGRAVDLAREGSV